MKLAHINLCKLSVSKTNMRYAKRPPDVADLLPSVRKRGVIVPVIVRPKPVEGGGDDTFEIVAGSRRFRAAQLVAAETDIVDPMPCAIMEAGDDAAALEASLIENVQRRDADEVTQWTTFTRLIVKEGRTVEDIAETFAMPVLAVKRILALGNLLPRIRGLYRKGKIDAATIRPLTLAGKDKQKEWLALYDDPENYTPSGREVKAWLFGGASIPTSAALFDLADYPGEIVTDLFGEGGYFADADQFWKAQAEAVEAKKAEYLDAGWREVEVLPVGGYFESYAHERVPRTKGGRVYVAVNQRGEVAFHEGYLTRKEARKLTAGGTVESVKPSRPEVTSAMQTYIDLHRHAAVRAALTGHAGVALRLMVAHAIVGPHLWRVRPEPQTSRNDAVAESVETCTAEAAFDEKRRAVIAMLGGSPDDLTVTGGNGDDYNVVVLFRRLLELPDPCVTEVIAIVMGETLASGSAAVEAAGLEIGVDMARYWQADDAFFKLVRDKEVLTRIVAEVAGESVAQANAGDKAKTMKQIVRDHLYGENGRAKVEGWVPKWMAFPPAAYTARGGVGTVEAHALVEAARQADDEPDPSEPANAAVEPEPEPLAA